MYQGEYTTTYSSMVTTFRRNDVTLLVLLLGVKLWSRTRHYNGCAVMHLALHVNDHPIWPGEKDGGSYGQIIATPRSRRVLLRSRSQPVEDFSPPQAQSPVSEKCSEKPQRTLVDSPPSLASGRILL